MKSLKNYIGNQIAATKQSLQDDHKLRESFCDNRDFEGIRTVQNDVNKRQEQLRLLTDAEAREGEIAKITYMLEIIQQAIHAPLPMAKQEIVIDWSRFLRGYIISQMRS